MNLMWTWEDMSNTALNDATCHGATVRSPIFRWVIAVSKKTTLYAVVEYEDVSLELSPSQYEVRSTLSNLFVQS